MSRLTCKYRGENALRELCIFNKEDNNEADYCLSCEDYCRNKFKCLCEKCGIQTAFDKLAEYEDLDEQGLLVKLPFKVGDKVWIIVNKGDYREHITDFEVNEITIKKINSYKKPRVHIGFIAGSTRRSLDTFGKTVFLTKEEAEQVLNNIKNKE